MLTNCKKPKVGIKLLKISYLRILFLVSLLFAAVINPYSVFFNFQSLNILVICISYVYLDYVYTHLCVTRPAKIDHVDTFKYLKNTNLKYSIPHNSPVPDSSRLRYTLEVQQGYSYC